MDMKDCMNTLAQANALLQNVNVHGKGDLSAMLMAMNDIESVMTALACAMTREEEKEEE